MSPDLDALIAEATVDCYGDDEQLTRLFRMIDDNVAVPFGSARESRLRGVDLRGAVTRACRSA